MKKESDKYMCIEISTTEETSSPEDSDEVINGKDTVELSEEKYT